MRWIRTTLVPLALSKLVNACNAAPPAPTTVEWNDAAAAEVQAQVTTTMSAFAAMDLGGFKKGLADDVVSFEMDLEGKPVRLGSLGDVRHFVEETSAAMKKMGAAVMVDFHATRCRATTTLAYCTVEFDLKAKMPDGNTMTQPSRNSVVLARRADGWKWVHWHSSTAAPSASPQPTTSR